MYSKPDTGFWHGSMMVDYEQLATVDFGEMMWNENENKKLRTKWV